MCWALCRFQMIVLKKLFHLIRASSEMFDYLPAERRCAHGSGVAMRLSFCSHFSQTIAIDISNKIIVCDVIKAIPKFCLPFWLRSVNFNQKSSSPNILQLQIRIFTENVENRKHPEGQQPDKRPIPIEAWKAQQEISLQGWQTHKQHDLLLSEVKLQLS